LKLSKHVINTSNLLSLQMHHVLMQIIETSAKWNQKPCRLKRLYFVQEELNFTHHDVFQLFTDYYTKRQWKIVLQHNNQLRI